MVISVTSSYHLKYQLKGIPGYAFADNKKLYNLQRQTEVKKTLIGYTVGFWIKGKFYSLKALKPLLEKYQEDDCPF